jgi:hypothetical protein
MDSLLIPLRSNAVWFSTPDRRAELERRLKSALVIHDDLVFQDGRYMVTVWEDGTMDWLIPPNAIPGDRTEIRYHEPGGRTVLQVSGDEDEWHPLFHGATLESIEVDFYPILQHAGLLDEDYIRFEFFRPTEEGKARLQKAAAADRRDEQLMEAVSVEGFLRKPLVEALHFDSALAAELRCPFLTDARVGGFIAAKSRQVVTATLQRDLRPAILDVTMELVLPDFASLSWDQVVRIRNSGAGLDLRRHLSNAAQEISVAAAEVDDLRELTIIIQRHYLKELAAQIRGESPTVEKAVTNFAVNLLPGVGAFVGNAADIARLIEYRNSWVALVGREL